MISATDASKLISLTIDDSCHDRGVGVKMAEAAILQMFPDYYHFLAQGAVSNSSRVPCDIPRILKTLPHGLFPVHSRRSNVSSRIEDYLLKGIFTDILMNW